jgi:AsmA protein
MARSVRRVIRIIAVALAAVLLLVLLGVASLLLFVDADVFRPSIERAASQALDRPLSLGRLHWKLGRRVMLRTEGGAVANLPGFDAPQLAAWRSIDFSIALWPLLRQRELRIDHLSIQGLNVDLQRRADGTVNWEFAPLQSSAAPVDAGPRSDAQPWRFALDGLALEDAAVRWRDAESAFDLALSALNLSLGLPDDLTATPLQFRDVRLAAKLQDWPLRLRADSLRVAPEALRVDLPNFEAGFDTVSVSGQMQAALGDSPMIDARWMLTLPSLRQQLARAGWPLSPMQQADAPGPVDLTAHIHFAEGALRIDELTLKVDDTTLQGSVQVPRLDPLSVRFDLDADRLHADRYLSPDETAPVASSEPFELPVQVLRSLDAKGTVRIGQFEAAGVAARRSVITVE